MLVASYLAVSDLKPLQQALIKLVCLINLQPVMAVQGFIGAVFCTLNLLAPLFWVKHNGLVFSINEVNWDLEAVCSHRTIYLDHLSVVNSATLQQLLKIRIILIKYMINPELPVRIHHRAGDLADRPWIHSKGICRHNAHHETET